MIGDGIQVSMFDDLPDMPDPQPKKKSAAKKASEKKVPTDKPDDAPAGAVAKSAPRREVANPPLGAEEAFTLENFLPYRILEVGQGISKRISRVLHDEWDMSMAEWQVLASLARDGAVSVREVEPRTLLDTVAVSRAAKRLTDRKFLKREVNKQDKRLVVLKTTKKGRDVATTIGRHVMELETEFLKGMNVQDRIRLSQLLKTLS